VPKPSIISIDPDIDPIAVARSLHSATVGLFQRFNLHTRTLERSLVTLDVEAVAGPSLSAALDRGTAQRRVGDYAGLLVFSGFEALVEGSEGTSDTPSFLVLGLRNYLEIDQVAGAAHLIGDARLSEDLLRAPSSDISRACRPVAPCSWAQDVTEADYAERMALVQKAIRAGEAEGAVLSVGLSKPTDADPFDIYRACIARNPSPYGYVLNIDGFHLVGSSPLSFARIEKDRVFVETDAGTRPVSGDPAVDAASEIALKQSAKDATEHDVVVQAELEALGKVAANGDVFIPVSREVRRFSHVMHLYSVLEAKLAEGGTITQALIALSPAAAVSGRPKQAAARIGRRIEGIARGPYGGIIGLIDRHGDADFAVVIRSLWISNGVARLRVGGKIVAGSEAALEYAEAMSKARFLIEAVERAEAYAR
jgi:anthranilate synthase component 1